MRNMKLVLTVMMVLGLVAGLTGCGSDSNDPAAPQGDTLTLNSSQAEDFSQQALDVVSEMVTEIPDIANADFGTWTAGKADLAKANTDSVVWDPAQSAWVFDYDGPLFVMEAPNYWNISLGLWVQYRNATGPMQFPLGATEMDVRYETGMDMHAVEGEVTSDLSYEMNTALTVSYLGAGDSYGVVGHGDTVVDLSQTGGSQMESGHFAMDWTLDIAASDQGCPSGTATVNVQQYQMVAEYDGLGHVNWTLTGPGYQASGTDSLGCGQPVY